MRKETYGVTTYKSTHHTIQAEGVFKEKGISFRTIPTPREITVSCGLAIIFALDDLPKVKEMVNSDEINIDGIYKYTKDGQKSSAERII
ncbi:DUF3343 domain-containing protein [Tissierella carlieri]|uniref:DUF3343 domain-containing protein n=1 Tax=Tissierella carlieri TaxID=689904 RepID=A0ABT1S885_9FIRM|nr:DUF3343 domain-containing protein [Tissierella carlieri]MBU5312060.1 DUF3343 domain-containing protein [Tissierella carlieri]MCQ4922673.1 DUF3343 domain-containing protein [Tissierella carlieri]